MSIEFQSLCPWCDHVVASTTRVEDDGSITHIGGDHRPHSLVAHPEKYASLPTECGFDPDSHLCIYGCDDRAICAVDHQNRETK